MIYILVITLILIIIYLLYVSPEQTETEIKNIKAINDYRYEKAEQLCKRLEKLIDKQQKIIKNGNRNNNKRSKI